ncbi:hypothetical protein GV819_19530 [Pseudomonas sp. Fl5BN2]|uniref:hypothetical protein n=1 Tax=Pseudomonas sp. Fl5BN2 TaxID=2697652 RepID=UPI001377ABBA|nr:hypothetical protein [Pseudomonas sp. Fl5BN2]NBF04476.1 hypothetical protein [Pseudomonas sp. Fl5BN2]
MGDRWALRFESKDRYGDSAIAPVTGKKIFHPGLLQVFTQAASEDAANSRRDPREDFQLPGMASGMGKSFLEPGIKVLGLIPAGRSQLHAQIHSWVESRAQKSPGG